MNAGQETSSPDRGQELAQELTSRARDELLAWAPFVASIEAGYLGAGVSPELARDASRVLMCALVDMQLVSTSLALLRERRSGALDVRRPGR